MTVLVTGCAGFIGHALCLRLLSDGDNVIGIDNLDNDYDVSIKEEKVRELKTFKNFEFIKLDILNAGLFPLLKGRKINYVVHLAAKSIYSDSSEAIKYGPFLEVNVTGTSNIFELAHKLHAKRFIFASTYSVYGNNKGKILKEKMARLKPISPHGASKLAAEHVIHFMHTFYGLPSIILRISSVYGPNMRPYTVLPKIIYRLHNGEKIESYSSDVTRDFIFIDDVVEYIISSFKVRGKFQIVNIASGESISRAGLGLKVGKIMGISKKNIQFTREKRDFERLLLRKAYISNARAKKLLKYTPQFSLDDGLPLTISWYLNNESVLEKSVDPARE
jgi:UDP-glucuronate 4-epimerase